MGTTRSTGVGASSAPGGAEQRLGELKGKYQSVLDALDSYRVQIDNLHVQDGKLFIKGTAPSAAAMNSIWEEIKRVDSNYEADLICDICDATRLAGGSW